MEKRKLINWILICVILILLIIIFINKYYLINISLVNKIQNQKQNNICIKEGGLGSSIECCNGLNAISDAKIDPNNSNRCLYFNHTICVICGNGICGSGENKCNCSNDCIDNIKNNPPTGSCTSDSQCSVGLRCWNEVPTTLRVGIPGTPGQPGFCTKAVTNVGE
jgi:hypothetical protein